MRDRYGIDPIQMIDFKGLKGDTSDNISGVPGIGEKTAIALLNQYRSIEEIYEHLDEVTPPRAQKALRENREIAMHSKRMATIIHDVPVTLNLDACEVQDYDHQAVVTLFQELEFRSLIDRLPEQIGAADDAAAKDSGPEAQYAIVRTEAELKRWVAQARKAPLLAVDPGDLRPRSDDLRDRGLCAGVRAGRCYLCPGASRR